jgi:hypothetical protein
MSEYLLLLMNQRKRNDPVQNLPAHGDKNNAKPGHVPAIRM